MRSTAAKTDWRHLLGVIWLLLPLAGAFLLYLDSQRSGVGYSFFYTRDLSTVLELAALLLLWLGPGLLLLWRGRRK